ncbi:MAG: hypothetical protein ABR543_14425 [Gemmatimonadaceae bacterium]
MIATHAEIRPLKSGDADGARALLHTMATTIPHFAGGEDYLRAALLGDSAESRGIVAVEGGALAGIVLYGKVAGTVGAGEVHFIITAPERLADLGQGLLDGAVADLTKRGVRLIVVELADVPHFEPLRRFLSGNGFVEEARIPDLYRDGVPLLISRREIAT